MLATSQWNKTYQWTKTHSKLNYGVPLILFLRSFELHVFDTKIQA
jgi:hypothetical protein